MLVVAIQDRLHKQRYSELNFRTPTNKELLEVNLPSLRNMCPNRNNLVVLRTLLEHPSKTDRYSKHYLILINDFFTELDLIPNNRMLTLLYNDLIRKLAYYLTYPQYYAHSFPHYSITWIFNTLMQMRGYILNQKARRGEIPFLKTCKGDPETSMYYKFPKPMNNNTMQHIAGELYDLVYTDTLRYLKRIERKNTLTHS